MRIHQSIKKIFLWSMLATILLTSSGLLTIFASPQKAKAAGTFAGREFDNSHFKIESGKLVHTYTVDGAAKTQTYSGETTVNWGDIRNVFVDSAKSYKVYQMDSSARHDNGKIGALDVGDSPYYIALQSNDPNGYVVMGMFFRSPCIVNCTSSVAELFYNKTFEIDDQNNYDGNSELYGYIKYISSYQFAVQGLSGEESNPCSIGGKINIDFTKNESGTETGTKDWSTLTFNTAEGGSPRAELWYKGPEATKYDYTDEEAIIGSDGIYKFDAKARPTGSYIVTQILIRYKNTTTFRNRHVDTLETVNDVVTIDASFIPEGLSAAGDVAEGFFGQTAAITLVKNCSNLTGKNITLKSIGTHEEITSNLPGVGDEDPVCGGGYTLNFTKILARAFCGIGVLLNSAANNFLEWSMIWLERVIGFDSGY